MSRNIQTFKPCIKTPSASSHRPDSLNIGAKRSRHLADRSRTSIAVESLKSSLSYWSIACPKGLSAWSGWSSATWIAARVSSAIAFSKRI